MLRSQYDLPFSVLYPTEPFFSSGRDVTVVVRLHDGVPATEIDRLTALMDLFVKLVNAGGMAGKRIDPARSRVVGHPAVAHGNDISFRLEQCLFDDAALVVLCQLFLHKERVKLIKAIEVRTGVKTQKLACDPDVPPTYPDRFDRIPYAIDDEEPETGKFMFALTLESPLDEPAQAVLQGMFDAWVAFIVDGGFALAPIPPENNYVEPEGPLVHYEDIVEWTVFKLRADEAALDALFNILAAFHGRERRIRSVNVS